MSFSLPTTLDPRASENVHAASLRAPRLDHQRGWLESPAAREEGM